MEVLILAEQQKGTRGYNGAELVLPATQAQIRDAMQRAHVKDGEVYEVELGYGTGGALDRILDMCEIDRCDDIHTLNALVREFSRMDQEQRKLYRGAADICCMQEGISTIKGLLKLSANLDSFTFYPGIINDRSLGEACIEGELLSEIAELPDETLSLLDPIKVGEKFRKEECAVFSRDGLVVRSSREMEYSYVLSENRESSRAMHLRLVHQEHPEEGGVWLDLPASGQEFQAVLEELQEPTLDTCLIAEAESEIPYLDSIIAGTVDFEKLNHLAEWIQSLSGEKELLKFKAALEFEKCKSVDKALEIVSHLECYALDTELYTPDLFAEYLLREAGVDTEDPAFSFFDFKNYGLRQLEKSGFLCTEYGVIARDENQPVQEETVENVQVMGM